MFKWFSRSKPDPEADKAIIGLLQTDMHSHLIPGIDDGAPDIETSLQLIGGLHALGYKKLITTPHIMWDMYRNTREVILERLEWVRTAVEEAGLDIEIHAAAEYFLDDYVAKLVADNEPLLTVSGNMVLVEFSMAYPSHSLKDILFDMQMQGYQPIIAHPERYIYLEQNKAFYGELKDIGCHFQLNLLSLTGYYGKSVNELAHYLMKQNFYDLAGTDLHHFRHLEALHSPALSGPLRKLLDSGKIKNAGL
ncbi:MAG: histidinol phosphatase [Sphingobacteriales bacterium]|nr:histidinol phosphatase [Sphingobacteriales bacterium]